MNRSYGSLEVFLTYTPADSFEVKLATNILGRPSFGTGKAQVAEINLQLGMHTNAIGNWAFQITSLYGDIACDTSDFSSYLDTTYPTQFRIVFFNSRVSVYANNKWIYSYIFQDVKYQTIPPTLDISSLYGAVTIDSIRRVELSDGREAVYADYESNTTSLIASVIQQRPVELYPSVDRSMSFTFDAELDPAPLYWVKSYDEAIQDNGNMSSDGIVYYADVGVAISQDTAEEVGLITKMYRLSELDTGAERAAQAFQKKALQQRHTATIKSRLDPRIQPGDVAGLNVTLATSNRNIAKQVIVEDITIAMREGDFTMQVQGRIK